MNVCNRRHTGPRAGSNSSKNFASTTGEVVDSGDRGEFLKKRCFVTVCHYVQQFATARHSVLTDTCTHDGTMRFHSAVGCCDPQRQADVICHHCADRERCETLGFQNTHVGGMLEPHAQT